MTRETAGVSARNTRDRVRREHRSAIGKDMAAVASPEPATGAKDAVIGLAEAAAAHLGGSNVIGTRVLSDADLVKAVERGLSVKAIDALKRSGITDKEIGNLIIRPRTLSHRREKGQRLTVEESDRAATLARMMALAERTFANKGKADRWLHTELNALNRRRPIDLLRTSAGARIVEKLLAKIAWGAAA